MRFWKHISLTYKLMALVLLTSMIVLLVASVAFVITNLNSFQDTMVTQLRTLAEVMGAKSKMP